MKLFELSCFGAALGIFSTIAVSAETPAVPPIVAKGLADMPVIDGHNDLPWEIRERFSSNLDAIDLSKDTSRLPPSPNGPPDQVPFMTDIPRLRAGGVGAQFWSVWIPTDLKDAAAVATTVEQIDLVKRMAAH